MGKAERLITSDVTQAHGGAGAQLQRVTETLRYLPGDVRDHVDRLIDSVFLESRLPWKSQRRIDALNELVGIAGGYPHAYQALMNYWPIAKSATMSNWIPPPHEHVPGLDDAAEIETVVGRWQKVTSEGHGFVINLREGGGLVEHAPADPSATWDGVWALQGRTLTITIGPYLARLEPHADKQRGTVWSGPETHDGEPRATVSIWRA